MSDVPTAVAAPATLPVVKKTAACRMALEAGCKTTGEVIQFCKEKFNLDANKTDVGNAKASMKPAAAKPKASKEAKEKSKKHDPAYTNAAESPGADLKKSVRELAAKHGLSKIRDAVTCVETEAKAILV